MYSWEREENKETREVNSVNLFANIEDVIDKTEEELSDKKFIRRTITPTFEETQGMPVQDIEIVTEETLSVPAPITIFEKNPLNTKGWVIKEYLQTRIEIYVSRNKIKGEISHKHYCNILKQEEGITIFEMLDCLASYYGASGGKEKHKEAFRKNPRASKSTVKLEKYGLFIKYSVSAEGVVSFTEFVDLNDYKYTGKELETTISFHDVANEFPSFIEAFSNVYSHLPSNRTMVVDMQEICRFWTGHTLGDVAFMLHQWATAGAFKMFKTRICSGSTDYLQCLVFNSYEDIPMAGNRYKSISFHKDMFGNELSEFEIKHKFRLPSYPNSKNIQSLITLPKGGFGFNLNGEMLIFKKASTYTFENPRFEITRLTNKKKRNHFKFNFKNCKEKDPNHDDGMGKIAAEDMWYKTGIKKSKCIHSESELFFTLLEGLEGRSKNYNFGSGSFQMNASRIIDERYIFDENTKWKDIITEGFFTSSKYQNETEQERYKRLDSARNIIGRFQKSFDIEGMYCTKDAVKYSNSAVDRFEGNVKDDVYINYEDIENMSVIDVLAVDLTYSLIKSMYVSENDKVKSRNREFKETLECYKKSYYGGRFNIKNMLDEDRYISSRINYIARAIAKSYKYSKEEVKELNKILKITDLEERIEQLNNKYNMEIENIKELKKQYAIHKIQFDEYMEIILNYENVNTLPFRTKLEVYTIMKEYNEATGNILEIQNLKYTTVTLIGDAICENEILKGKLGNSKVDKEHKKNITELNRELKRFRRLLKKNVVTSLTYNDLKTAKTEIKVDETCDKLEVLIKQILDSKLTTRFNFCPLYLEQLITYIADIRNRKFEISNGTSYTRDLGNLSNLNCKLA